MLANVSAIHGEQCGEEEYPSREKYTKSASIHWLCNKYTPFYWALFHFLWSFFAGMRVFSFLTDFRFFRSPKTIFIIDQYAPKCSKWVFLFQNFPGYPPAKYFQFFFITIHSQACFTQSIIALIVLNSIMVPALIHLETPTMSSQHQPLEPFRR